MMVRNDTTGVRRLVAGLALAVCLLGTLFAFAPGTQAAPAAPAQQPCGLPGYPDCPPPPTPTPICILLTLNAVVGGTVSVQVTSLPVGTQVDLLLGTTVVASGTVPGEANAYGNITLSFVVPPLAPGSYTIVAVAGELRLTCGAVIVQENIDAVERNRGGGLALTGTSIAALVAIALLLLTIGFGLMRRSRHRRRVAAEAERILARTGWARETVDR
jgi:hypothetical protein